MAKSARQSSGKPATIHDQKLERGNGGELHQLAEGDVPSPDDGPGRPGRRRSEHVEDRRARSGADRGFSLPREDLPLRPRAHSRARRARARLRRARLLRDLRIACRLYTRRHLPARRREDARLRALLDRRRFERLLRPGARRARLRRQILHEGRQLGSRRQQHPGFLHPGCDQVSGHHPCGEARARPCLSAGAVGARQFLGLHQPDAGIDAHDHVGHVRPRHPALLPVHAGLWRAHVPAGQCEGRIHLRQIHLEAEARHAVGGLERGGQDQRRRSGLSSPRPVERDPVRRFPGMGIEPSALRPGVRRQLRLRRSRPDQDHSGRNPRHRSRSAAWCSTACRTISSPRPSRSRS